jgi:oligoribonuclease
MKIAWLDVESNGLTPPTNKLLQVACLVTDGDLNILDETGYEAKVLYTAAEVVELKKVTVPFVLDMHEQTGLWSQVEQGKPLSTIDSELHEYLSRFAEKEEAWLGGNSITLDRNFINEYLPASAGHLSYQSVDVTSVAGLAKAWYDGIYFEKTYLHEAMSDIRESIEQLRWFRKQIFK